MLEERSSVPRYQRIRPLDHLHTYNTTKRSHQRAALQLYYRACPAFVWFRVISFCRRECLSCLPSFGLRLSSKPTASSIQVLCSMDNTVKNRPQEYSETVFDPLNSIGDTRLLLWQTNSVRHRHALYVSILLSFQSAESMSKGKSRLDQCISWRMEQRGIYLQIQRSLSVKL